MIPITNAHVLNWAHGEHHEELAHVESAIDELLHLGALHVLVVIYTRSHAEHCFDESLDVVSHPVQHDGSHN